MFNNWCQWREEANVEEIHKERFEHAMEIQKLYPRFFHKLDKKGRPVWIKRHHSIDVPALIKLGGDDWQHNFTRHHIRENEKLLHYRLPACANDTEEFPKVVLIMDLLGFPLMTLPKLYGLLSTVSQIDADYYPECLGKIIVINAGVLFAGFWRVIRGFLPEETVEKVSILGSAYQTELLELIDEENLPEALGGTCNCGHIEGGCEFNDEGPWNDGSVEGYPQSMWEDFELQPIRLEPDVAEGEGVVEHSA